MEPSLPSDGRGEGEFHAGSREHTGEMEVSSCAVNRPRDTTPRCSAPASPPEAANLTGLG